MLKYIERLLMRVFAREAVKLGSATIARRRMKVPPKPTFFQATGGDRRFTTICMPQGVVEDDVGVPQ